MRTKAEIASQLRELARDYAGSYGVRCISSYPAKGRGCWVEGLGWQSEEAIRWALASTYRMSLARDARAALSSAEGRGA